MSSTDAVDDSPGTIRDRVLALADYLMAVRAQMEKPARTVPTSDAFWQHQLPIRPGCEIGAAADDASWLRVSLPPLPRPVVPPREFVPLLVEPVSPDRELALRSDDEAVLSRFRQWRDGVWRPWAAEVRDVKQVRQLHDRLFELKHTLDMNSATNELVWGHGILAMTVDGHTVRYPLITTPVMVEYDPDQSLVTVSPQGGARLQTDALTGLPERYLRQLLELGQHGGQVAVNVWEDYERIELFERAMRRIGLEPAVRAAHAPAPDGPHIHDTSVLFVRPKQRMIRRFLEGLRERLEDGNKAAVGALAAILAHEPTHLRMPGDQPERWRQVDQRLLMPLFRHHEQGHSQAHSSCGSCNRHRARTQPRHDVRDGCNRRPGAIHRPDGFCTGKDGCSDHALPVPDPGMLGRSWADSPFGSANEPGPANRLR